MGFLYRYFCVRFCKYFKKYQFYQDKNYKWAKLNVFFVQDKVRLPSVLVFFLLHCGAGAIYIVIVLGVIIRFQEE